jgi:hypothetical protein
MMTAATQDPPKRVPAGEWGGQHAALHVSDSGAELEFDCAHGQIARPLTLDADNRFDVRGTLVPETPGPRREDETAGRTVRYTGKVEGKSMTLTIAAADGSADLGTYALEHGRAAVIKKCQ